VKGAGEHAFSSPRRREGPSKQMAEETGCGVGGESQKGDTKVPPEGLVRLTKIKDSFTKGREIRGTTRGRKKKGKILRFGGVFGGKKNWPD